MLFKQRSGPFAAQGGEADGTGGEGGSATQRKHADAANMGFSVTPSKRWDCHKLLKGVPSSKSEEMSKMFITDLRPTSQTVFLAQTLNQLNTTLINHRASQIHDQPLGISSAGPPKSKGLISVKKQQRTSGGPVVGYEGLYEDKFLTEELNLFNPARF